jgi:hypothetical protein
MSDALDPRAGLTVGLGDIVLFFDLRQAAHHNQRHRVVRVYTDPTDGIDMATIEMTTGDRLNSPLRHLTMIQRAAEPTPAPAATIAQLVPIAPVEYAARLRQPPRSAVERQPKTAAERVRASEARRRDRGEVAVKVWVPDTAEARAGVRAFAAALVAKHAKAASGPSTKG